MTRLLTQGFQVWYAGNPLPSSRVSIYLNQTTTLATVYEDAAMTVPADNPVLTDINGFVNVYLDPANLYTVVPRAPGGAELDTYDNVPGQANSVGGGTQGASLFATFNANDRSMQPSAPTGDGTTGGWHRDQLNGDNWMSTKSSTDVATGTWSEASLITGAPGADGDDGSYVTNIYTRDTVQPGTPSGVSPSGWSTDPDSGSIGQGNLWWSQGRFTDPGPVQVGNWSTPVQIEGESGTSYIFIRSATVPATPSGVNPAGWSDAPPADDGNPLWYTIGVVSGDGLQMIVDWAAPTTQQGLATVYVWTRASSQPTAPTGDNPTAPWSPDPSGAGGSGFLWMSTNTKLNDVVQGSWTAPVQVEGEVGVTGNYRDFRYRNFTVGITPSGPAGNEDEPAGWLDAPAVPAADEIIWMITGTKEQDGSLIVPPGWSLPPVPVSGENGINAQVTPSTIIVNDSGSGPDYSNANAQWTVIYGGADVTASADFAIVSNPSYSATVNATGYVDITSTTGGIVNVETTATYAGVVITGIIQVQTQQTVVNPSVQIVGGGLNVQIANGTNVNVGSRSVATQNITDPVYQWSINAGSDPEITIDGVSTNASCAFESDGTDIIRTGSAVCQITADNGTGDVFYSPNLPIIAQHGTPP